VIGFILASRAISISDLTVTGFPPNGRFCGLAHFDAG
jgi:hypothetical protein